MISNEQVISKITTDLYNKKIILHGDDDTTVVLKCSTINEFCELLDKCKKLLKTDIVICR